MKNRTPSSIPDSRVEALLRFAAAVEPDTSAPAGLGVSAVATVRVKRAAQARSLRLAAAAAMFIAVPSLLSIRSLFNSHIGSAPDRESPLRLARAIPQSVPPNVTRNSASVRKSQVGTLPH